MSRTILVLPVYLLLGGLVLAVEIPGPKLPVEAAWPWNPGPFVVPINPHYGAELGPALTTLVQQSDDSQPAATGEPTLIVPQNTDPEGDASPTQGATEEMAEPAEANNDAPAGEAEATDDAPSTADSDAGEEEGLEEAPGPAEPEPPRRELSPELVALRDSVRPTLASFRQPLLNSRDNTATDMINFCLANGCYTEVYLIDPSTSRNRRPTGSKINGITCLCWDYPCADYRLLTASGGHVAARIGYGLQQYPSQFIAMLALSRVPPTYPIRVGEDVRTVADLVEHEKLTCRSGTDQSLKLIGLMYYIADQSPWTNDLDEEWSIERMLQEELDRPPLDGPSGGTHRLLALGYAVQRQVKNELPVEGQFLRAQKYIDQFTDYALNLQNSDGSWHPRFFEAKGTSRDAGGLLRSTGHILEWLAVSLPVEQLEDPRILRSVAQVNRLLGSSRDRRNIKSQSVQEIESVMHAVHALSVYDTRVFKPADPPPEEPSEEEGGGAEATAQNWFPPVPAG